MEELEQLREFRKRLIFVLFGEDYYERPFASVKNSQTRNCWKRCGC